MVIKQQLFVAVLHSHDKMPYLEHLGKGDRVPARVLPDVDLGQSPSLEIFLLILLELEQLFVVLCRMDDILNKFLRESLVLLNL